MSLPKVESFRALPGMGLDVQFHRQVPMLNYIVDFYCHEIGLAIEIDGHSHDFNYFNDAKRQGKLEAYGVQFLRFSNGDILHNMFSVLLTIEEKFLNSMHHDLCRANLQGLRELEKGASMALIKLY